ANQPREGSCRLQLPDRPPRLPLDDVPGDRRCSDGIRRREIELPRTAPTREVPVLRADRDLILGLRRAGPRGDARAAAGLDELGAHRLEQLQVTALVAVLPHLL